MKALLTKLFSPILKPLENSSGDFQYSPSHRKILYVMGFLFMVIAAVTVYFSLRIEQWAAIVPVILFSGIGLICIVVASLGSDKAVSKLWRNRNES